MEVIFVDDGSEDETLSIINSYVPRMNMKVKVFHHEWKGLGASRNVVVDNSNGDYIVWVDGDMILPINHVRKQVEFMEGHPKVGIGKARYGILPTKLLVAALENIPFVVFDSKNGPLDIKLPGTGGAIFRIEAIHQVKGFDESLKGVGEDQDIAYRIKASGWNIERTTAFFLERRTKNWKSLWQKYFWYGYGNYELYRKNNNLFKPYRMTPLAGFVAGTIVGIDAYRLTRCKIFILLPFHFAFKMTAWCFGFIKGRLDFSSRGF
jgi:glycosyltransferase involved in cell wall biosynthesis